jgi:hypothetical protein
LGTWTGLIGQVYLLADARSYLVRRVPKNGILPLLVIVLTPSQKCVLSFVATRLPVELIENRLLRGTLTFHRAGAYGDNNDIYITNI